jgi:hypothetical protein
MVTNLAIDAPGADSPGRILHHDPGLDRFRA